MKYIFTCITLILILPLFTSAQGNYKPGYVVTLKGDTLRGFINYKDWNKNPKSIEFKKDAGAAKAETYSIYNALAFSIKGVEYYSRFAGNISQDAVDINFAKQLEDTSLYKIDTVFLRIISTGKNATLYEYNDVVKPRYFISAKNTATAELSYHVHLDGDNKVQKERGYTQQLQNISAVYQPQNSALIDEIANSDYTVEGLQKIVFKINGSVTPQNGGDAAFIAGDHAGTRFFAGAGVSYSNTYFTGQIDLANAGTSSSVFPLISGGMDILLNKDVGTAIVRTYLSLSGSTGSFLYNAGSGSTASTTTYKFSRYSASFTPQLLYNLYNTSPFKLYIAAGADISYSMYKNTQYDIAQAGHTTDLGATYKGFVDVTIAPIASAGIVLNNKWDIFLNYIVPDGFDVTLVSAGKEGFYQVGVNFLFGHK